MNIQQINEAYGRLLKGDVKYRFVIDMASLKNKLKVKIMKMHSSNVDAIGPISSKRLP